MDGSLILYNIFTRSTILFYYYGNEERRTEGYKKLNEFKQARQYNGDIILDFPGHDWREFNDENTVSNIRSILKGTI